MKASKNLMNLKDNVVKFCNSRNDILEFCGRISQNLEFKPNLPQKKNKYKKWEFLSIWIVCSKRKVGNWKNGFDVF